VKLPPKRILIRIVLYVVIFSYLGWEAWSRYRAEQHAQDQAFKEKVKLLVDHQPRSVTLPDGSQMPIFELTPAQFEERFGEAPPTEVADPGTTGP
jgi:hypothetical protein